MEVFAVLGGLALLGWLFVGPLVAVVLAVVSRRELQRLQRRVVQLEADLDALAQRGVAPAGEVQPRVAPARVEPPAEELPGEDAAAEEPAAEEPAAEEPAAEEPAAEEPAAEEPAAEAPPAGQVAAAATGESEPDWPPRPALTPERLAVWVASAVGALSLIVGALLALAVAIDRGWLGPAGRSALGLVSGTAAMVGGAILRRRGHRLPAQALAGAGLGTVYGSLWASHTLYDLLPRLVAGGAMAAVVGVAFALAAGWRARSPAWLGLLGGLLTPFLLSTGQSEALAFSGWLAVLAAGAVATAARRGWPDLAVGATLGTGALMALWAAENHRPEEVPLALLGVALLLLPHLLLPGLLVRGEARRDASRLAVVAVAAGSAVVLPLLALPWLPPVDPRFMDPRTGAMVIRDLGAAPTFAAAGALLLPVPGWLLARREGWWPAGLVTSLVASLLVVAFVGPWADHAAPPLAALTAVVALPTVLAVALSRDARVALPLPLVGGLAGAMAVLLPPEPAESLLLAAVAPGLAAMIGGVLRRSGLLALVGLLGGALTLGLVSLPGLVDAGGFGLSPGVLAGCALLVLGVGAALPAAASRLGDQAWAGVVAGAAAPPLLFLPLYVAWLDALGDTVVGLLPLLLGALALGTAVLLTRARRVGPHDAALALFVAVALAGITAAIPLQLERQWLTVAWALEAAALAALSQRLLHPLVRWGGVALAVAVAVRLLANPFALEYGDTAGPVLLNWTLYTWGVPALCLALAARWLEPWSLLRGRGSGAGLVPAGLRVLAILVGFALVNVQVSHAFQDAGPVELGGHGLLQGMVRSLAWAAYGIAVLVAGMLRGAAERAGQGLPRRHVRLLGFAIVMVAAAKVFAVDLWSLEGFVRVGSVLGLGISLLLAAFLFERLVLRGAADPAADAPEPPEAS